MLYKKIVKRGVKNLTFMQNFLQEKLDGNAEVIINVSEKVYDRILCKYARHLEYHCMYDTEKYSLFYNDGEYSFEVLSEHFGQYGPYYKLHIADIEKLRTSIINKRLASIEMTEQTKELYMRLVEIQVDAMLNPFRLSVKSNVVQTLGISREEYNIIQRLEELEDE